jgi:hypothetical protein
VLSPSPFVDASPWRATILDILFPKRIVYQHILLLHQIFFFLSIALSRVVPVLFPSLMRGDPAVDQKIVRAIGERLGGLAKTIEWECECTIEQHISSKVLKCACDFDLIAVSIMLNMEMNAIHETPMVSSQTSAPLSPEILKSDMMRVLEKEMEDIIVEDMLKSEVGPVKTAWDAVIDKERRKRAKDWRLRETANKIPPPPETCQVKMHNRARSLSL